MDRMDPFRSQGVGKSQAIHATWVRSFYVTFKELVKHDSTDRHIN